MLHDKIIQNLYYNVISQWKVVIKILLYTTLYSPFIPESRWLDFNVNFYSNLFSGIISGVFTGIIVGVIIWKLQSKDRKKQIERECTREANIFLQNLKEKVNYSPAITISEDPVEVLPSNTYKTILYINENPLAYWISNLKKSQNQELGTCLKLLELYRRYVKSASHLDAKVTNRLIEDHDSLNYSHYLAPFYGLLSGVNIDKLNRFFHLNKLTPDLIKRFEAIQKEENIEKPLQEYICNRDKLLDKFNELDRELQSDR
ncbi:hypothetical protein [Salipaludibacillus sp. CF4.18]|uniref:hypothetical protein n=1 Tax=Salipaludibacillus sp. CF4.18 TaxID=3373081 RepID=UPI003EE56FC9